MLGIWTNQLDPLQTLIVQINIVSYFPHLCSVWCCFHPKILQQLVSNQVCLPLASHRCCSLGCQRCHQHHQAQHHPCHHNHYHQKSLTRRTGQKRNTQKLLKIANSTGAPIYGVFCRPAAEWLEIVRSLLFYAHSLPPPPDPLCSGHHSSFTHTDRLWLNHQKF